METKENLKKKGKRSISIFTIFLWIGLIVVMSAITITGINQSNALEGTRTVTLKIDFTEIMNQKGITDSAEIEKVLETLADGLAVSKTNYVTSKADLVEADIRYIGSENDTIGVYEMDVTEESKYIIFAIPTAVMPGIEIVSDSTKLPEVIYLESEEKLIIYGLELYEDIDEYKLISQKNEAVTLKLDISEIENFEPNIIDDDSLLTDCITLSSDDYLMGFATFVEKDENMAIFQIYPISGVNFDIVFAGYKVLEDGQEIDIKEIYGEGYCYKDIKFEEVQSEYQFKLIEMERAVEIRLNVVGEITAENDKFLKELVLNGSYMGDNIEIPFDRQEGNMYIYKFIRYDKNDNNTRFEFLTDIDISGVTVAQVVSSDGSTRIDEIYEYCVLNKVYHILNSQIEFIKNNTDETYVTNKVRWLDKEKGIAQIYLGHNAYYRHIVPNSIEVGDDFVYYNKLSDEFVLSPEYELDSEWEIVDSFGSTEDEILYNINEYLEKGKKYLYVKNDNTIYWFEGKVGSSNSISKPINVIYKKYEVLQDKAILEVNNKSVGLSGNNYYRDEKYLEERTIDIASGFIINDIYNIKTPALEFNHTAESIIKVNKEVVGEKGNNTYYVGLFTDDTSNKTDKVYKIDTVDGGGNITIEVDNKDNVYYIYEVDENGNKVSDDEINYNKNKVEFTNYIRDAKITTDKSVVSSLKSDIYFNDEEIKYDEENNLYYVDHADKRWKKDEDGNWYFETDVNDSIGAGEEYVDNMLSVNDIYQEDIIISSEIIKYNVKYEAEDGGKIEEKIEEEVILGEKPQNVPTPKPDEGYKFVRWEVEENGKRVEVIPSEYEINKDTIFYAVFEKIPVELPADTSDINVGVYVVVSLVAIIGTFVGIVIIANNKRNKKAKMK